jgi:hypothetical protein
LPTGAAFLPSTVSNLKVPIDNIDTIYIYISIVLSFYRSIYISIYLYLYISILYHSISMRKKKHPSIVPQVPRHPGIRGLMARAPSAQNGHLTAVPLPGARHQDLHLAHGARRTAQRQRQVMGNTWEKYEDVSFLWVLNSFLFWLHVIYICVCVLYIYICMQVCVCVRVDVCIRL